MKKSVLIISLLVIAFMVCMPVPSKAFSLTDVFNSGDRFLNDAEGKPLFDEAQERATVNTIFWLGQAIAIGAAVILGLILGIQLITNSASGKAKVKEKLIPYAVGVVVALGAFGIWRVVFGILNQVF